MQITPNEFRKKYITNLNNLIRNYQESNTDLYWENDNMEEIILVKHEEPIDREFYYPKQVIEELESNSLALLIFKEAMEIMNLILFENNQCYAYNLTSLPFIKTRSISKLETNLTELIIEGLIMTRHNDNLDIQLDNIEEKMKQLRLKMIQDEKAKYEAQRNFEINTLGFPKTEIIKNTKEMLIKIQHLSNRYERINGAREIFNYLSKPYCIEFMNYYPIFKQTVKKKLFEFRDLEFLKESRVWWRNLFNERMSVEYSL